jgi:Fic family protein
MKLAFGRPSKVDIGRFTEFKTGQLEPIETQRGSDWAFVPNPLPPNWTVPTNLWPLIVKARDRVGRLDGIGRTLPDPFLLLRPLQRREALRSSSLEGTYISPKELFLFELDKHRHSEIEGKASEWREVYNYYLALQKGRTRIKAGSPINSELIKLLHRMLMTGTRGEEKSPGEFRDCQVFVGASRRFIPPPVTRLTQCVESLEQCFTAPPPGIDELVMAFIVHYQFEAIHPFKDGNGRIGRLLLSLMIFDWLNLSEPWLYLSEYFERFRSDYTEKMFRVSAEGDWEEWIRYCLEGTIQEAESAIERCAKLRGLKERYLKTVGSASIRMHAIIDYLFSTPVLNVLDAKKRFGVTYPTAKADITKLVDAGILMPLENTHPQAYGAREIWDVAFG